MSFLSSRIKRSGDVLKRGAAGQIIGYAKRFSSAEKIYEQLFTHLIVSDFSFDRAYETARKLFGSDEVKFAAVDGTEYSRPLFDLMVFFGGSCVSTGNVTFSKGGPPKIEYSENFLEAERGISSCIPIYVNEIPDVDQTFLEQRASGEAGLIKPLVEETIINNSSIANWIMTFSEFYLAYRLAIDSKEDVKIILLDRSLSNMQTSLSYDTSRRKLWKTNSTIFGLEVEGISVDMNDLAYGRHRFANKHLNLPPPRGDYLRYSIIYLIEESGPLTLEEVCGKLGIEEKDRKARVKRYLEKSISEKYLLENTGAFSINPRYENTWKRLRKLVDSIGHQLFEEKDVVNPMLVEKEDGYHWLTTQDIAFLTLFCLYMLVEECWARKILLIGITKDTTARDFKNHVVPVCLNNSIWTHAIDQEELGKLPNTDRMLLQSMSLFNHEKVKVPWSLVEYDSAFQMIVPDFEKRKNYVSGAVRNKIIPERLFLKSYIQLSEAENNPKLRSNVLYIDRLAYPEYDLRKDTVVRFNHKYGGSVEPIETVLFAEKNIENPVQNLVMVLLKAMTSPSIPEAFGHNKPLYIADKVAKNQLGEMSKIIDSTGQWIINNPNLREFVFYMSTFRERRAQIESTRREFI